MLWLLAKGVSSKGLVSTWIKVPVLVRPEGLMARSCRLLLPSPLLLPSSWLIGSFTSSWNLPWYVGLNTR